MLLKNTIKISEKYTGNSKFEFWKNLKVGDVIEVSINIERIHSGGNGLYATPISFNNTTQGEIFDTTMNMAVKYINNIKYIYP